MQRIESYRIVYLTIYSFRSNSFFRSSKEDSICRIAFLRFAAYFENRSCCLPDHISFVVVSSCSTCAVTITRIGYLSTQSSTTFDCGNTLFTACNAVRYSCFPPSQFRDCVRIFIQYYIESKTKRVGENERKLCDWYDMIWASRIQCADLSRGKERTK